MVEVEGRLTEVFLEFMGTDEVEVAYSRFLMKLRDSMKTICRCRRM